MVGPCADRCASSKSCMELAKYTKVIWKEVDNNWLFDSQLWLAAMVVGQMLGRESDNCTSYEDVREVTFTGVVKERVIPKKWKTVWDLSWSILKNGCFRLHATHFLSYHFKGLVQLRVGRNHGCCMAVAAQHGRQRAAACGKLCGCGGCES